MMNGKEIAAYNLGLARALDIIQANHDGVRALEQEIEYRNARNVKVPLTAREVRMLAREQVKPMLYRTAIAMAAALRDIKLPATMIKEYLVKFNTLCDIYQVDEERFKADCKRLDSDFNLAEVSKSYMALTAEEEDALR